MRFFTQRTGIILRTGSLRIFHYTALTDLKKIYSLRTEAERYNSRFKSTGQERLWVKNFKAAQNLNTISHIALLAVAYAAIVTKSEKSYRSLKDNKRLA